MPIISVQIEVLNSKELVEKKKGKIAKWAASIFIGDKKIKKKVEEQVCAEVVKTLQNTLKAKLREEGVDAKINISVKNDAEIEQV
jgi:hypothetical protein